MRLGELLIQENLVTREGVQEALEAQVVHGGRLGTNLVELGLVQETDLARILGKLHGVPHASGEMNPDPRAMELLAKDFCDDKDVLPMRVDATRLSLACINPHDLAAMDEIAFKTGKRVTVVVIPEFRMNQLLRRYCKAFRNVRAIDMNTVRKSRTLEQQEVKKGDDLMSEDEFNSLYAQALTGGGAEEDVLEGAVVEEQAMPVMTPARGVPAAPMHTPSRGIPAAQRPGVPGQPQMQQPQMPQPPQMPMAAQGRPQMPPAPAGYPGGAPPQQPHGVPPQQGYPQQVFPQQPHPGFPQQAQPGFPQQGSPQQPMAQNPPHTPSAPPVFASPPPPSPATLRAVPSAAPPVARVEEPPPTPISFAEAQQLLSKSSDREDIARTVLRFAISKWRRSLILSVQGPLVTGWHGAGHGIREKAVQRIGIALRGQTTFKLVCDLRSHYVGPMKRDAATAVFYKLLGGGFPQTAVILPLLVREKIVHLLYVDNGPDQLTPPDIGELLILGQSVTRSYETLLRKRLKSA
ncbi:MAG: hypothetical protein ACJ790_22815 [Myxococcaceae bacterium]